jgi:hypothetical protein
LGVRLGYVPAVNRPLFALMSVLLLGGCRKGEVAVAPPAVDASVEAGPAAWALTLGQLDGYLRYQRAVLARPLDAGVEERATLDEQARLDAGLSVDAVEKIEAMIGALANRKLAARMVGAEEALPLPPAETEKRSPEKEEALAKSIAARAELQKASKSLQAERAQFGSANIDVLLLREKEVLELWGQLLGLPAEKGEKR